MFSSKSEIFLFDNWTKSFNPVIGKLQSSIKLTMPDIVAQMSGFKFICVCLTEQLFLSKVLVSNTTNASQKILFCRGL